MNGSTANEIGEPTPSIPGPYRSPEQTEAYPLKQSLYRGSGGSGNRTHGLRSLTRCCSGSADNNGASLRIIILCFVALTLAVIIALAVQIYYGDYQLIPHGSVATDNFHCSVIGTDVLKNGGNAVDAAVASVFCLGVVNPHATGLGGGGFMIIYNHRKQKVLDVIDFREAAPASISISNDAPGSYVGVPGVLRGLAMAHQLHGKLPWKDVITPAVQIARTGFYVPETLFAAKSHLDLDEFNGKLFNWTAPLEAGQNLTMSELAATLELISVKGPNVFYNGSLAKGILVAVTNAGGKMTEQDLASYQAVRRSAQEATFADFNIFVPDLPSGGPALLATLGLLPVINSSRGGQGMSLVHILSLVNASENIYRQALRGIWGDPNFLAQKYEYERGEVNFGSLTQSASSHVAAVDLNDIYVSVVSGLNTWFGSQLLTNGGFVLNNALVNFGVGKNSPFPGKRPLSLATPIIAVERRRVCGRRLVLGSADMTVAAQLLSRLLVLDTNITWSVEAPRFQIADGNKSIFLEDHVPPLSKNAQEYLQTFGYRLQSLSKPYQSCNIVEKVADELVSHSDSRGGGVSSRF
ncbi:gamma-glutamyltransferase 7-like isoform X2 [Zootermopsis nevadensis]|uniref:Gamma-glutamyltransferase 7 n=1 Tax=Zootermopsis nevadensis TaxID=136037 RepID=A0A067QXY3_ZOONE|nr:gamma-glutamyltransferase 7-like isoform X2 [Zootermopsis nevadensis]KDR09688.1 Gamma-glutamyltransferase 7 [Zootermopsis nevadensis]